MDKETVISVENVSKKYCKSLKKSMYYGAMDIGRNMFGLSSQSERLRKDEFWALNDISFEVRKGETLGIIGPNGSGKTTLLKLLNGIFWPDKGKITIKGKIGSLIEIGAGFHPLLTGRENIYINAAVLGMTKKEVDEKFNSIVRFADVGDFIETPVKYYSSGMYVRLGFAVVVHFAPDILLVDEVLAVGDIQFQMKCFKKIDEFKEMGKTIIIVTHDMGTIQKHTDCVVLLHKGFFTLLGTPKNAINKYYEIISEPGVEKAAYENISEKEGTELIYKNSLKLQYEGMDQDICPKRINYNRNEFRYGNGLAKIIDYQIMNDNQKEIVSARSLDLIIFRIKVKFYEEIKEPIYGFMVKTKDGAELYKTNTLLKGIKICPQEKGSIIWIEYKIRLNLGPGEYFLSAGVAQTCSNEIIPLDRRYDFVYIFVLPSDKSIGIVNLNAEINFITNSGSGVKYCEPN